MFTKEFPTEKKERVVFTQRKFVITKRKTRRRVYILGPDGQATRICYSDNQKRFPIAI